MNYYTAITPGRESLTGDLAPLLSPILAKEASAPDEYVGHTEGVVLDEAGRVVAFIVRLARKLSAERPRTLVAADAIRERPDGMLQLSWSEDQLAAMPRLDEDFQPHSRVEGRAPVESQWMPARPAVIPPGAGADAGAAAKEALQGGIAGAAVGAVAGFVVGGPLGAAALAAFFAAGGGLAGAMSGASHETAAEAGEMKLEGEIAQRYPMCERLERALEDRSLVASGIVHETRFVPFVSTETRDERLRAS